jgi:Ca2+-binding EF-hand superfamily protein
MGDAEAEAEVENIMNTVDTNNSGTIDYSGIFLK